MSNYALVEQPIVLSVDSAYGSNISDDGASFRYDMSPPLKVPSDAVKCEITCPEANVQYTFPNLSKDGSGDYFGYSFRGTSYLHEIPQGIYSMDEIASYMNRVALQDGISTDADLFSVVGIESTQKVTLGAWIQDGSGDVTIDFSDSSGTASIRELLGFDTQTITYSAGGTTGAYLYQAAENVATFSSLTYVQVLSSIVNSSVGNTGAPSSTLCTVTPDVSVGSEIVFRPSNPLQIAADNLIGSTVNSITFRLVDNSGTQVNTMGESWSMRIQVKYWEWLQMQ